MTLAEENYLKTIYHLENQYAEGVPTNAIAENMDTKASSATDMIKRLSEKNLLAYKKYQGAKLSVNGKKHAIRVIRKHRLWECFLVDKLNFAWDEVHDLAEQLEHIQSEQLTDRLEAFLGNPTLDPHGDPIPNKEGKFKRTSKKLISDCGTGDAGIVMGVKDSSPAFLQYLDKSHVKLGASIKILEKETFDNTFNIQINSRELTISHKTASNLYIKPSVNER